MVLLLEPERAPRLVAGLLLALLALALADQQLVQVKGPFGMLAPGLKKFPGLAVASDGSRSQPIRFVQVPKHG